jgi:hypothetical protein
MSTVFLIPRIPDAAALNYRRSMTTAGIIVTAMTLPVLLGQLVYAISRGTPSRDNRN